MSDLSQSRGIVGVLAHSHAKTSAREVMVNYQNRIKYKQSSPASHIMLAEENNYLKLLAKFPPRPINSEAELRAAIEAINSLLDKPGELNRDERDYLNVLGTLVHEYEETLDLIPDIYGVEMLKALIEEHNLRQKDLVAVFKTESIVSAVLKGDRQLTAEHIQK
ncbi:MAG: hypothetical protein Fur0025_03000 [Oscillatoriaceae cyanobacterium]